MISLRLIHLLLVGDASLWGQIATVLGAIATVGIIVFLEKQEDRDE